jgi:integrase
VVNSFRKVVEPSAGFGPFLELRIENPAQEMELFEKYLRLKKNMGRKAVYGHICKIGNFLRDCDCVISPQTVDRYLEAVKEKWKIKTYANYLCSFRRYIRDFKGLDVNDNAFPDLTEEPVVVPSKEELQRFFEALPDASHDQNNRREAAPKYKALFLFLASSGLRLGEALSLRKKDITSQKRMVIPNAAHETNSTKNCWVTFYNEEAEKYLTWLDSLKDDDRVFTTDVCVYVAFKTARKETGISITPQKLREWFAEEMGNLGVPDRYIDALCGRVPNSVLARRYTDYSPEKLRVIYEKAKIRVL